MIATFDSTGGGRTMKWHCCDCHRNFQGPIDRSPKNGCEHCGSRNVFDCNLKPISKEEEAWAIAEFTKQGGKP